MTVRGAMIWFNEDRDEGYIRTEEDERLYVAGPAFIGGNRPEGRCGGLAVEFEVIDAGGGREARNCEVVTELSPPRARRRRHS